MKKNLMILATIVACFGLLTMTGCEETTPDDPNGNEQTDGTDEEGTGNEDGTGEEDGNGEGDEPAIELSILKQWVADLSEAQDGSTRKCFDLSTEGSILVGDWMPGMEAYMDMFGITEYDPATSFIAMVTGPEQIVSITPDDETSGTVTYSSDTDMDGIGDTEFSLTYSNLTETTVDITMADVYSGGEATYNCRAADEPVKVYTYADASM